MIRRFLARLGDESGFSLIELMASMILSGLIAASLIAVFSGMSQNSADLAAKADAQGEARGTMAELVIELRQAARAHPNVEPIEALSADRLAFTTTRYDGDGLIRVVYERSGCIEGLCDLHVYRYPAVSFDGEVTTFATEPEESSLLIRQVMSDQPLFRGVEYAGDPLVRSEVIECSEDASPCRFPVVAVTIRVRPQHTSPGASLPVDLREEVRLRNG
jgi:prepilin-type N-terminal cleavage/methylation domain-containing protein